MFRLFEKGREKIGGFIGGAGLENWWLGEFDDEERRQINRTYRPMGSSPDVESILTTGPIQKAGFEAVSTLSNVATWFKRSEDRTIAYRFLQKAEELLPQSKDILTAHFFYQAKCQVNYRWREIDDFALQRAIDACRSQIAIAPQAAEAFVPSQAKPVVVVDWLNDSEAEIQRKARLISEGHATSELYGGLESLPSHHGFKQLAIILQKRGDFDDALAFCREAKAQGWNGDWEKRIARLSKQLEKQSRTSPS